MCFRWCAHSPRPVSSRACSGQAGYPARVRSATSSRSASTAPSREDLRGNRPRATRGLLRYRDTGECGVPRLSAPEVVGSAFRDAVLEAAAACRSDQSLIIVRTHPPSRGASSPDGTRIRGLHRPASITATGRNWYPLAPQPRERSAHFGAWHRTTSGLARIS